MSGSAMHAFNRMSIRPGVAAVGCETRDLMSSTDMLQARLQRGFTLLEALVVLGLIAVLVLIAIPQFLRMLYSYRVQTAASQIATNLQYCRGAALKQKINYQVLINDEGDLFNQNTYAVQYDSNRDGTFEDFPKVDVSLPPDVTIKSGSVDSILFSTRGNATLNPANGKITLEGTQGIRYEIQVTISGSITVNKL